MQNPNLRSLVTTFDAVLTNMLATAGEPPESSVADVRLAWARLVAALDVEPDLDVRACPYCRHTIMRSASRCGFCWRAVQPGQSNGA